ncbi:MAG: MFS transporter, partial [Muribaculaceae bacterium]|nr:MFS transporter [Muribaculaceae bacterium]
MEYIKDMPLTWRHIWIVFVASLGQLIGTGVATLAGVIIPMINIIRRPELSSVLQGLIGASDLLGIMVGSVVLGRLSDRFGYIFFFRLCPILMLIGSVVGALVPDVTVLIICLFVIGVGIGGEYSLDSGYISELLPVKYRSLMIGCAKAGSAFGNVIVALVCYMLIVKWDNAAMWPALMWIIAFISVVMIICRIWFYQSPQWLLNHGRTSEAEHATKEFLGGNVEILPVKDSDPPSEESSGLISFIKKNFSKVVLSGVPWACEGLGVYGIGVFLPILVMALGIGHDDPAAPAVMHVAYSVKITFYISCIILPGFIAGLILIHRRCYIPRIQVVGFWICAVSLVVLLVAFHFHWSKWISIGAFMSFELFLNMGPHLVTYVLPPMVYKPEDRGQGSGLAASIGKFGAVAGVFIIPVLLHWGGPLLT